MKKTNKKMNRKKKIIMICGIFAVIVIAVVTFFISSSLTTRKRLLADGNKVITGKNIKGKSLGESVSYNDKEYVYNNNLVNILVLGVDLQTGVSESNPAGSMGQSDAMYLISVDVKKDSVKVYGIPRDSMSEVEVYNTDNKLVQIANAQITLQYAFGNNCERSSELSAKSVSGLMYGVPIHRVCVFNYEAIAVINDAVGGVEVTFENDFSDESGINFEPEFIKGNTITLNSQQAFDFLWERDCNIQDSALDRLSRQEQYIANLAAKFKTKIKKKPWSVIDVIKQLNDKDSIYTDMSTSEILYLSQKAAKSGFNMENVLTLPGRNSMGDEYVEYNIDNEQLKEMIVEGFYKEKK